MIPNPAARTSLDTLRVGPHAAIGRIHTLEPPWAADGRAEQRPWLCGFVLVVLCDACDAVLSIRRNHYTVLAGRNYSRKTRESEERLNTIPVKGKLREP
jgi:hypothetical protein